MNQELGSMTAKGGFINETIICTKFENHAHDQVSQNWLRIMGYEPEKIQTLSATQIPVRINRTNALSFGVSPDNYDETVRFKKADIQLKITINGTVFVENISLKKSNASAGFNQIDKRPVSTYQNIWGFNDDVAKWLRLFTGDIDPKEFLPTNEWENLKDFRRMFLYEIPEQALKIVISYFQSNKIQILSDILKGRGDLSAEWFLVTRKNNDASFDWVLKDITTVVAFFSEGDVQKTPRGSLKIGKITAQRKGGTPDPKSLQFKINPLYLFQA